MPSYICYPVLSTTGVVTVGGVAVDAVDSTVEDAAVAGAEAGVTTVTALSVPLTLATRKPVKAERVATARAPAAATGAEAAVAGVC